MHTLEVVGLGILIAFLFALSSWTRAGGLKGKGKSLVRWRARGEPNSADEQRRSRKKIRSMVAVAG